ncbi:MAG: hypothetical protein ABIJ09_25555 [Pseudomonadota bacterium]
MEEFESSFAPNLSSHAVFLKTRSPKSVGTPVRVQLHLRSGVVVLSGEGRVLWSYPGDAVPIGRSAGMGIAFTPDDADSRVRMQRIVANHGEGVSASPPGSRLHALLGVATALAPSPGATGAPGRSESPPAKPQLPPALGDLGDELGDAFAAITTDDAIPVVPSPPPRPVPTWAAPDEPEWLDAGDIELIGAVPATASDGMPHGELSAAQVEPETPDPDGAGPRDGSVQAAAETTPSPVSAQSAQKADEAISGPGVLDAQDTALSSSDETRDLAPAEEAAQTPEGPWAGPAATLENAVAIPTGERSESVVEDDSPSTPEPEESSAPDDGNDQEFVAAPAADLPELATEISTVLEPVEGMPVPKAPVVEVTAEHAPEEVVPTPTSKESAPEQARLADPPVDPAPAHGEAGTPAPPPLRPLDRLAAGLTPDIAGQRVGDLDPDRLHGRLVKATGGPAAGPPDIKGWYWIVGGPFDKPWPPQPLEWPVDGTRRPVSKIPPLLEDDLWTKLTEGNAASDWTANDLESSPAALADGGTDLPLPLKSIAAAQRMVADDARKTLPTVDPGHLPSAGATDGEVFATTEDRTSGLEQLEQSPRELDAPVVVPADDGEFLSWGDEVFSFSERAPAASGADEGRLAYQAPRVVSRSTHELETQDDDSSGSLSDQETRGLEDGPLSEAPESIENTVPGAPSPLLLDDKASAVPAASEDPAPPWDESGADAEDSEGRIEDTTPGVVSPFAEQGPSLQAVHVDAGDAGPEGTPFASLLDTPQAPDSAAQESADAQSGQPAPEDSAAPPEQEVIPRGEMDEPSTTLPMAAVQADSIALSLPVGIALPGGRMRILLESGTRAPYVFERNLQVPRGQNQLELDFHQGDAPQVQDNAGLGAVMAQGDPETFGGRLAFDLRIVVEPDGVLDVTVRDPTGAEVASGLLATLDATAMGRSRAQRRPLPVTAAVAIPEVPQTGVLSKLKRLFGGRS